MSRITRNAALMAIAGLACGASAQTALFDAGPHCTVRFDAANTGNYVYNQLGLSSGNLGGANTERWVASPFSLFANSTVTEFRVNGFVPAGSEFLNLAWRVWTRPAGNAAPTAANLVASGEIPIPAPVDDPRLPAGLLNQFRIPVSVNLNAGNYYFTVFGKDANNTGGTANFAWFTNAQRDITLCPPNTPIVMFNGSVYHTWRSTNFSVSGFGLYSPPVTTLTTSDQPPWGPNPQDPQYLFNTAFGVFGNGALGTGACCLTTGSCSVGSAEACCTGGGIYQGDGSVCGSCPQPGSCCLENGTCISTLQVTCTGQGGIFGGAGSPCGTCVAFGFNEGATDAGDLPGTATPVNGNGQALEIIRGTLDLDDVDMYKVRICNEAAFQATTVGTGTAIDTMLFVFNSAGVGLAMSDDTSATVAQFSTITSQFIPSNGDYYVALSSFNNTSLIGRMPLDATATQIWNGTSPAGFVYPEWAPNGPSTTDVPASWTGATELTGAYSILFDGTCFLGGNPCYANCDQTGGLTANDFICFLTAFNNNQPYADCDQVGGLTANDFICFVTAYNAGCS
jgi:hypothetical protein